ncbi:MAG: hypothetical protein H0W73_03960 [Bacteroidetes bacterium]|nr:hypothetical protein [Bacteroidota bacterium]
MNLKRIKPSIKKTGLVTLLSITTLMLAFTFCKKDRPVLQLNNQLTGQNPASERLINNYSGVTYNATTNMLEFISKEVYEATVNKLEQEIKEFKMDNDHTEALLSAIINVTDEDALCDSLNHNSPLSDTVFISFINRPALSEGSLKKVIKNNLNFSVRTIDALVAKRLSGTAREQLQNAFFSRTPYSPGLSDFENLFPGYQSYRLKITDEELKHLASGGDPESLNNPMNANSVSGPEASLYNKDLEVKIGNEIIKITTHTNIIIKDNYDEMLAYVRANNNVPIYTPPLIEPANGFAAAEAQPIVPASVLVYASDYDMMEQDLSITVAHGTGDHTYQFSSNITGSNYKYFWNFGDGKISYKANPIHVFDGNTDLNVELSVFDLNGTKVWTSTGGHGQPQQNTQGCVMAATFFVSQAAGNFATANIDITDLSFNSSQPINYTINWGDGTPLENGSWNHTGIQYLNHNYSSFGHYNCSIIIQHVNSTQSNCIVTKYASVHMEGSSAIVCCTKNNKLKQRYVTPGNNFKFMHRFKVSNNFATHGKLDTEIHTYHRVKIWFVYFWFPINATASLSLDGGVYVPCNNSANVSACALAATPIHTPPDVGTWYAHNFALHNYSCYYYLAANQIVASAYCFGTSSFISLTPACN